jgi:hypothetical protein
MPNHWCDEHLFTAVGDIGGNYHFDYAFRASGGEWCDSNGNRWQRLLLLHACIGHDSPGRHRAVDMELQRAQQHVRYSRTSHWTMGFYSSWPGSCFLTYLPQCGVVSVLLHSAWGTLRYGRDGYRVKSKSITVTDTDGYGHGYGDTRAHADSHPGGHNQRSNKRCKRFRYTQWLSQSAWNNHDGQLSVWPDDQLRIQYSHADSDRDHGACDKR